jgi:hypothetical protein
LQRNFVAEETAKIGLATGAAGCSDQGDQKANFEVSINFQQGEAKQKEGSSSSNNVKAVAATTNRWSG